jgi:hemerythrin superfamily protein
MAKQNPKAPKSRQTSESEESILSRLGSLIRGDEGPPPEGPVKATDLLKADHDKVRGLFKRFDDAQGAARAEIVENVSRELTIHAAIEEELFYPALQRSHERDTVKMVRESFEEHKIVKTLIQELSETSPRDPQFEAKFTVLREAVEHHAEEEEDDLFPDAQRDLGDDRLLQLGTEMQDRKKELMPGFERGTKPRPRSAPAKKNSRASSSRKSAGRRSSARPRA